MKQIFDFTRIKNITDTAVYTEIPPIGHKEQIGVISLPKNMFNKKPPRHLSITITWKD